MKTNARPILNDRHGGMWDRREVTKAAVNRINNENYFSGNHRMNEDMKDVQSAQEKLNAMLDILGESLGRLQAMDADLGKKAKAMGGNVRDAAEKLTQGLAKVEKAANFDRLERMTELLERSAAAMTTLAELDKNGRLEKIAAALR